MRVFFDLSGADFWLNGRPAGGGAFSFEAGARARLAVFPSGDFAGCVYSAVVAFEETPVFDTALLYCVSYGGDVFKLCLKEPPFPPAELCELSLIDSEPPLLALSRSGASEFLSIVSKSGCVLRLCAKKITVDENGITAFYEIDNLWGHTVTEFYSFEDGVYALKSREIARKRRSFPDGLAANAFIEAVIAGDDEGIALLANKELLASAKKYQKFFGNAVKIESDDPLKTTDGEICVLKKDGESGNLRAERYEFTVKNGVVEDINKKEL